MVKDIIQTVGCHTLTVCLSALSLTASGMEPEELLAELKTCGLNIASGEDVELYKDNDFVNEETILEIYTTMEFRLLLIDNISAIPDIKPTISIAKKNLPLEVIKLFL